MADILNKILGAIEDRIPIFNCILLVAFIFLAFWGVMLATTDYNLAQPLPFEWHNVFIQFLWAALWPFTRAPLWYKLAFFIIGAWLLLPRLWWMEV